MKRKQHQVRRNYLTVPPVPPRKTYLPYKKNFQSYSGHLDLSRRLGPAAVPPRSQHVGQPLLKILRGHWPQRPLLLLFFSRGAGFGVLLPVLLELAYVVSPPPDSASQGLPLGASMTLRSWPPRPICRIECSVDESPCSLAASSRASVCGPTTPSTLSPAAC